MKTKILFFSILLIAFLTACQKDEIETSITTINGDEELLIPTTATLIDEKSASQSDDPEVIEAEEFAKLLATSINNKDIRAFIKEEANKKFDGDFDILVSKVMDSKIGQSNFKEKVEQSSSFGPSKGKEVFGKAIKNPKLNISVPIQIENWNDSKQQLLVAVAVGYIDGETKLVKAFDSKGRTYLIDASIEPNVPVIVVGNNERMDYQEEITNNQKSARISGHSERLLFVRCPHVSAIEGWLLGAPEIRFEIVVYNNDFSAAFKAATINVDFSSRSLAEDGKSPNMVFFNWYFDDEHGPDYYIQSAEIDDTGATHKITVGVTAGKKDVVTGTATYELTYKNGDEILAGRLINYREQSPTIVQDDLIWYWIDNI